MVQLTNSQHICLRLSGDAKFLGHFGSFLFCLLHASLRYVSLEILFSFTEFQTQRRSDVKSLYGIA